MTHPIRTIDLATVAAPSSYIGRRAAWTDFNGDQHVGVLAPDPFGGAFPVVDFEDGTHGRNGSVVTLVIEPGPPCLERDPADDGGVFDLPYRCTRDEGHTGRHESVDQHDGTVGRTWPGDLCWRGLGA